jgi:hypothetical protein
MVQEPAVVPQASSAAAAPLGMVDRKRLQHLLNRGEQLLRSWERTQTRWLVVTLVKAEKLASLDHNGFSDP